MSFTNNVVLPGVPSYAPPGIYTYLQFAQGGSGAGLGQYYVLLLGNMVQDGYSQAFANFTAGQVFGPDTLVPLKTVNDAINLFSPGSPLALMYAQFRSVNSTTPIYVAPVLAATGTNASQTITVTALGNGSVSNGQTSGVIQYQVDQKFPAQCLVNSTDSSNTVATNLALAINGNVNLPVTASAATNVVTITAKVPGARGNNLRGFGNVVSGSGVSLAGAVNTPAYFTSGAGSDAAGYLNTLNALQTQNQRYYYVIPEAGADFVDGTTNGIAIEVQAFVDQQSAPNQGNRERAIFGSNDTVAHTTAVTTTLNDARCEVIQCNKLDLTAGELAATWGGAILATESVPLTAQDVNFDGFGADQQSQGLWGVPAPLDGSAPSASDVQTCIISGVTPLQVVAGRQTRICKRVTTRWFVLGGSGGTQPVLDLRITDAGVVTVCDRFFDDLSASLAQQFPRQMIGQDTASGAPPAPPGVVTPDKVRDTCIGLLTQYGAAGLVNAASCIAGLIVQQNNPPMDTSIGIVVPLFVNSLAHQFLISGARTVVTV